MSARGSVRVIQTLARTAGNAYSLSPMNFRIVWMGSDDDPAAQQCSVQQAMGRQSPTLFYEQFGAEMVRCQRLANGQLKRTSVANFTARIVRDSIHENDAEQQRELTVEAEVGGRTLTFVVRAAEFNRMGWVLPHLGPEAIIYPGQQQHARAAIQWLSVAIVRDESSQAWAGTAKVRNGFTFMQGAR